MSTATAVRLSLAPGTTGLRCTSAKAAPQTSDPAMPVAISAGLIASRAERDQAGGAEYRPPQRQRGVLALEQAGEAIAEPRQRAVVEDRAGQGGVVVREDHQRGLGVHVSAPADDVPGGSRSAGGAAKQPGPVGDVLGDRRGGQRGDRACEPPSRLGVPA